MKPPVPLLKVLMPHEQKIELALIAAILFSAGLNYLGTAGAQSALIVTMVGLAMLYFVSAYFPASGSSLWGIIARKVVGLSSAVVVVGLLFTVLHLPGAHQMLLVGVGTLALSGSLLLYAWLTSQGNYFALLIRVVILGGIGVSTLMALWKQPA